MSILIIDSITDSKKKEDYFPEHGDINIIRFKKIGGVRRDTNLNILKKFKEMYAYNINFNDTFTIYINQGKIKQEGDEVNNNE